MTAQEVLESAFQKVDENAQLGCDACQAEIAYHGLTGDTHSYRGHTCAATIDAAAEGMLAAVEGCHDVECRSLFREPPHPLSMCSACRAKATINRLREEAKK